MTIKITPPGSKSITNRALVLATLGDKEVTLKNCAICDDSLYMVKNLQKLGVKVSQKESTIKIKGNSGVFPKSTKLLKLYTGNAGTTTRFLTALCTLSERKITLTGDKRMQQRPILELTKALNSLGAKIENTNGCPPLKIHPQKLRGGKVIIPGNISSQYISALLMTCPKAEKESIIKISNKLASKPYIQITLDLGKKFGLKITNKKFEQFTIKPQQIKAPRQFTVESDASSASYIGAYAALNPHKNILIKNIFKKSIQGDIAFLAYLKKMGCEISETKEGIKIKGPKKLKCLGKIDMNKTPDLVMTFAILAMFTEGITKITNIENLRIKETDRIQALKNEISKLGVKVKSGKSYLEIHGDPEKLLCLNVKPRIQIETYNDHRMAMCFGMISDIIPCLKIKNPSCVSKSYTTFWKDLKKLQK